MTLNIRDATPADVPQILQFAKDLATYEREPDAVTATEADIHEGLFGPQPLVEALIAEIDGVAALEPSRDQPSHQRHPGLPTHQNHISDLGN